jgi:hypothetical protein
MGKGVREYKPEFYQIKTDRFTEFYSSMQEA